MRSGVPELLFVRRLGSRLQELRFVAESVVRPVCMLHLFMMKKQKEEQEELGWVLWAQWLTPALHPSFF